MSTSSLRTLLLASLLVWSCLGLGVLEVRAQQPQLRFERVRLFPELRGGRVNDILQDRLGHLWVATEQGLFRYDAHHDAVTRFVERDGPSHPSQRVSCLVQDDRGRIWVGTAGGLFRIDCRELRHEAIYGFSNDSATRATVVAAHRAQDGHLWFSSTRGLLHWDPELDSLTRWKSAAGEDPEDLGMRASDFVDGEDGCLWVGTTNHGLVRIDRVRGTLAVAAEEPGHVRSVVRSPDGELYCATKDGLFRWNSASSSLEPVPTGYPNWNQVMSRVRAIHMDGRGNLWMGGPGAELLLLPRGATHVHSYHLVRQPQTFDSIQVIIEDQTGAFWVGAGSGLYRFRYDPDCITIFQAAASGGARIPLEDIRDLAVGTDGDLWLATKENGLWRMDRHGFRLETYFPEPKIAGSLPSTRLTTLSLEESGRRLWVGTGDLGLWRMDLDTREFERVAVERPEFSIASLCMDGRGRLWVGARQGVFAVDHESGQVVHRVTCDFVEHFADYGTAEVDREGHVWMGLTHRGVIRIDPETLEHVHYFEEEGATHRIPLKRASSFCPSADGSMWIGAFGYGLVHVDPRTDSIRSYPLTDATWDMRILAMCEDTAGRLWAFHAHGMSEFDPRTGSFTPCESILPADYVTPLRGSWDRTPDGVLYLGGWSGFTKVRSAGLARYYIAPKIELTAFHLLQGERRPILAGGTPESPVHLPWDRSSIGFDFHLLRDPGFDGSRVQYRLLGFDENWHAAARSRGASYANLMPGPYTLEVRGSNSLGVPSEGVRRFHFRVDAPYWQAGWFRILIALGLGGFGLVAWWVWRRVRLKHRDEMRRLEEQMQRVQKLESLGVLAGGIAHDFNNLLTVITGNASLATLMVEDGSEASRCMSEIETVARRASQLTRQMLDFAGTGRGRRSTFDLTGLILELDRLLQAAVSKKVRLDLRLADGLPAVLGDPAQVQQVVLNLVRNASEAIGDEPGCIEVETVEATIGEDDLNQCTYIQDARPGNFVKLIVRDDGCGIEPEAIGRIFDPFFTTKFTGRGLGLASVVGIVRRHGGAIHVESRPGQGTCMTVLFPVVEHAISEEEKPIAIDDRSVASLEGCTVLVVDDESSVRRVACQILDEAHARTLEAADGQQALERLEDDASVDVVLLDLTMPRVDGLEVLERMVERQCGAAVVLSSGYPEARAAGITNAGRASFLAKPYTREQLREAVRQAWMS